MMIDSKLMMSEAQAITATAVSTNEIDMGVNGENVGEGNPVYLEVYLDTGFDTSVNTLTITLQDSADGSTYADKVVVVPATATSALLTADIGRLVRISLPADIRRYIAMNYTVSTGLTSGKVSAFLTIN